MSPSRTGVGSEEVTGTGFSTRMAADVVEESRRERVVRSLRAVADSARSATNALAAVVSPAGRAAVAGAVVLLAAGYVLHWTELTVVGWTLALTVTACALFLLGSTKVHVGLGVDEVRTVVGTPVHASVQISERGRRWWGSRVFVRLGDESIELRMPARGGQDGVATFTVPALHRGVVTVGPVRTVRGDPIGLFRRHQDWTQTVDVHVHPVTIGLPTTSTGLIRDLEGNPTNDLTASDISFHALRDYRAGDERRHIHWKATAHTGALTVRQFEETRRSHIIVGFGLDPEDYADEDELELTISAAASVALRAVRDHRELTVVTSPRQPPPGRPAPRSPRILRSTTASRLLDDVSELAWGDAYTGLGGLARLSAHVAPGISLVFLVCGSNPSMRDLRSWSLLFPVGVQVVAIRCRPERVPSMRRIAELTVMDIGYLEDLPVALAKSAAS